MKLSTIALSFLVAGCSCSGDMILNEDGVITEITMYGAHSYEDCGAKRGCRRRYVADTWWLNFKVDEPNAHTHALKIDHPPWEWQQVGKRIRVKWVASCSFGSKSWDWSGFDPIQ